MQLDIEELKDIYKGRGRGREGDHKVGNLQGREKETDRECSRDGKP